MIPVDSQNIWRRAKRACMILEGTRPESELIRDAQGRPYILVLRPPLEKQAWCGLDMLQVAIVFLRNLGGIAYSYGDQAFFELCARACTLFEIIQKQQKALTNPPNNHTLGPIQKR